MARLRVFRDTSRAIIFGATFKQHNEMNATLRTMLKCGDDSTPTTTVLAGTPHKKRGSGRLRGRFGIDVRTQSPHALQPLESALSPLTRQLLAKAPHQQGDELYSLRHEFLQRIKVNEKLYDLQQFQSVISQALENGTGGQNDGDRDCFLSAKHTIQQLQSVSPCISRFMINMINHMQQLAHEKLHRETIANPLLPNRDHSNIGECSSSSSHATSEEDEDVDNISSGSELEKADDVRQPTYPNDSPAQSTKRHPTSRRTTYRTTLRSRQFPVTRVPESEYVTQTTLYAPCDQNTKDISLSLPSEDSTFQWKVVVFPKKKPRLTVDQLNAFTTWSSSKLSESDDNNENALHHRLVRLELICYELCRLVFDSCPTTARFLYGLVMGLIQTAQQTLWSAQHQTQVISQRSKNIQTEVARVVHQKQEMDTACEKLEETVRSRQVQLIHTREIIIRLRKRLNLLLSADQVVLRQMVGLFSRLQEMAEEVTSSPTLLPFDPNGKFPYIEELLMLLKSKYSMLPLVAAAEASTSTLDQLPVQNVLVVDRSDILAACEAYQTASQRVSRMLRIKCPDAAVGWEAQEVWDHALFIPPYQEIQDLERYVQRLCLEMVEQPFISIRQRGPLYETKTVAVQTESNVRVYNRRSMIRVETEEDETLRWRLRRFRQKCRRPLLPPPNVCRANAIEDHQELLMHVVPPAFKAFLPLESIPSDYTPTPLSVSSVHTIISYLLNETWLLIQQEIQTTAASLSSSSTFILPLASLPTYVYRIYLARFRLQSVVTSRLLDLLVSISQLDTQSPKVLLFARLIALPGVVDPLSMDGWCFFLISFHLLQQACVTTGHYWLVDRKEIETEYCPLTSVTDVIGRLFSNETQAHIHSQLMGLTSVHGTVWIPTYSILWLFMEEWKQEQEQVRHKIEHELCGQELIIPSLTVFTKMYDLMQLQVTDRMEIIQIYRKLLRHTENTGKFYEHWVQHIVHVLHAAHHQTAVVGANGSVRPIRSISTSSTYWGDPSETFTVATSTLSTHFLHISWESMHPYIIRRLEQKYTTNVGFQVRLIGSTEKIVKAECLAMETRVGHPLTSSGSTSPALLGMNGWRALSDLIHIAYT